MSQPTPWSIHKSKLRPGMCGIVEIHDVDGETVLPWPAFDAMNKAAAVRLAERICRAVNGEGEVLETVAKLRSDLVAEKERADDLEKLYMASMDAHCDRICMAVNEEAGNADPS